MTPADGPLERGTLVVVRVDGNERVAITLSEEWEDVPTVRLWSRTKGWDSDPKSGRYIALSKVLRRLPPDDPRYNLAKEDTRVY